MAADSPAAALAWLPDWRDASAYPAEPSDNAWRWQFLRRHPQYQSAWSMPWDAVYRKKAIASSLFTGSVLSLDVARDMEAMHPGIECHEVVQYEPVCSRFGVNFLLDPALPMLPSAIEEQFWRKVEPYGLVALPTPEQWERAYDTGRRAIVFDLRFPLDLQVKDAAWKLEHEQQALQLTPPNQKKHPRLFQTYLRVLDARARQPPASWGEISEHLPDVGPPTEAAKLGGRAQTHLAKFFSDGNPSKEKP